LGVSLSGETRDLDDGDKSPDFVTPPELPDDAPEWERAGGVSALDATVRELARQVVREELARHTPEWEWLTVDAAAELLGTTPKAIRGKLERGVLEAHRFDGRVYLSRRELDEAIRKAPDA
jgi:excisionase family DNA binding protein